MSPDFPKETILPTHGRRRPFSSLFRGVLTLVVVLSGVALLSRLVVHHPIVAVQLILAEPPESLAVPVQGVTARGLVDTWNAPRSGGRQHRGIDIFSKRGTPILANTRGLVLAVGTNSLGGQTVRVLGPGPQVHYFAHLDRYGEFRRGDLVKPGDVLGYVGNTGNARSTPPHLHYGIYASAGAINPFPLLRKKTEGKQ